MSDHPLRGISQKARRNCSRTRHWLTLQMILYRSCPHSSMRLTSTFVQSTTDLIQTAMLATSSTMTRRPACRTTGLYGSQANGYRFTIRELGAGSES